MYRHDVCVAADSCDRRDVADEIEMSLSESVALIVFVVLARSSV